MFLRGTSTTTLLQNSPQSPENKSPNFDRAKSESPSKDEFDTTVKGLFDIDLVYFMYLDWFFFIVFFIVVTVTAPRGGGMRHRCNSESGNTSSHYADQEVAELLAMLREEESLEEQGDILQYLVDTHGLEYNTGIDSICI